MPLASVTSASKTPAVVVVEIEVYAYAFADVLHERVVEVFLEFVEFVEEQGKYSVPGDSRRGDVVAHAGRQAMMPRDLSSLSPANTVSRERR